MPRPRRPRPASRAAAMLVAGAAAVSVVAGCSSDGGTLPAPKQRVTGNGRHFTYDEASVPKSQWPSACTLLSRRSAAAALGTSLTRHRFQNNCYYVPHAASFPTMTISLLAVGNSLDDEYQNKLAHNSPNRPRSVHDVGEAAKIYKVHSQGERHLDVLAGNALFELVLKVPKADPIGDTKTEATLVAVGKVVAKEFAAT